MTLIILNDRGATMLDRSGLEGNCIPWKQIDTDNVIPEIIRDQTDNLMKNTYFMSTIGVTFYNRWQVLIHPN